MKTWIVQHKFYLVAGTLLVLGGLYYFFGYQSGTSNEQDILVGQNKAPSIETTEKEKEKNQNDQSNQKSKEDTTIIVDIKGEVKQPGVYHSNLDDRVIDVIGKAGGVTENADQSQVNFAAHVQDEMVIYIPAKGEVKDDPPAMNAVSKGASNGLNTSNGKVNINKADESELENLPGIGPSKAASIVQYRQEHGPFRKIEDLKNISGIGDKTFEKLKEAISIQ